MILYNQEFQKTDFPIDFSVCFFFPFFFVFFLFCLFFVFFVLFFMFTGSHILAFLLIKYNAILDCNQPPEEALQPILHEEVEIAVAALKKNGSLPELIISQQNLFKLVGRSLLIFNRDL